MLNQVSISMNNYWREISLYKFVLKIVFVATLLFVTGCRNEQEPQEQTQHLPIEQIIGSEKSEEIEVEDTGREKNDIEMIDVHSIEILVNEEFPLPVDYEPQNLVYPDVRFIFDEKVEKR